MVRSMINRGGCEVSPQSPNENTQKIHTDLVLVTPVRARELLASSAGNRRINTDRVEVYVRDMLGDRWYLGETIKFNNKGNLIDGHHRLQAVINYGLPVWMLVTWNLPEESIKGIDLGQPRSKEQLSKFLGDNFSKRHFAIARAIEFGFNSRAAKYVSYDENRELILKYEEAVNFAILHAGHERYINAPLLAVIARAYYSRDHERLIEFLEVIKTGLQTSPEDWAAQRLRNYFEDARRLGQRPSDTEIYLRAELSVWHFCKRNPIKILRPANKELFPLVLNSEGRVVPE